MIRLMLFSACVLGLAITAGCHDDPTKGWSTKSIFTNEVKTVAVPIATNTTQNRQIGFMLTDAVIKEIYAARKEEFVEEDCSLVDLSIVIAVAQNHNPPLGDFFAGPINIGHVADQFADPHLPVSIKLEHAGHVHQWFGGYFLDDEAGCKLE